MFLYVNKECNILHTRPLGQYKHNEGSWVLHAKAWEATVTVKVIKTDEMWQILWDLVPETIDFFFFIKGMTRQIFAFI